MVDLKNVLYCLWFFFFCIYLLGDLGILWFNRKGLFVGDYGRGGF